MHLPVNMYYAHVSGLSLQRRRPHVKLKSMLLYGLFVIPIYLTAYTVLFKEPFLKKSPQAPKLSRVLSSFSTLAAERLLLVFKQEDTNGRTAFHSGYMVPAFRG